MALRAVRPVGLEYLGLVTELLQRQRLADPKSGLWEAADLQWWYTRDPHPLDEDATVWLEGDVPVAAAVFTRWSATRYGCDVLGDPAFAPAWEFMRRRCSELAGASIEMRVAPDDTVSTAQATEIGFVETDDAYYTTWLDAADRPKPRELPEDYAVTARPEQTGPHPMMGRNGPHVEQRLRDCSLYDPRLDLAVHAADGTTVGYGMFWADERTGVGLVEPMRIEVEHAGRGLAGVLLRTVSTCSRCVAANGSRSATARTIPRRGGSISAPDSSHSIGIRPSSARLCSPAASARARRGTSRSCPRSRRLSPQRFVLPVGHGGHR